MSVAATLLLLALATTDAAGAASSAPPIIVLAQAGGSRGRERSQSKSVPKYQSPYTQIAVSSIGMAKGAPKNTSTTGTATGGTRTPSRAPVELRNRGGTTPRQSPAALGGLVSKVSS